MAEDTNQDQNQPPAAPPPPPRTEVPSHHHAPEIVIHPRKLSLLIPASLAIGCLPWVILVLIILAGLAGSDVDTETLRHVALIRVDGVITAGSDSAGLLTETTSGSETIVAQLERARRTNRAKGVLIRINSPGGSPAGSEEVYNAIMRLRESGKPVYVSMGDVAASGGYYIASAADRIFADSSTLTGSIGVISQFPDVSRLFKMIGFSSQTLKAGKYKDLGNPSRSLTLEERGIVQQLLNNTYMEFMNAVARGRNMTIDQVKRLAEGRIYDGIQAKAKGLIDEIGGLQETTMALGKACKFAGRPRVIDYGPKGILGSLFGDPSSGTGTAFTDKLAESIVKRLSSPGLAR